MSNVNYLKLEEIGDNLHLIWTTIVSIIGTLIREKEKYSPEEINQISSTYIDRFDVIIAKLEWGMEVINESHLEWITLKNKLEHVKKNRINNQ